ncbi:MAG: hypothetical protein ACLR1V_16720 [Coprococcus sp.]
MEQENSGLMWTVHHPAENRLYCLGIMFDDDASCNFGDTVRDRNLLQKNVLQRMGWNILNLWLLDWYEDSGDRRFSAQSNTLQEYDRINDRDVEKTDSGLFSAPRGR